jgi:demethoxyubiquinone hydroxylase (CLK1/Coq7/Cat5 family)
MACNCVRDNESRIADHYSEQLGTTATAEAKNVALLFGGKAREAAYLPYAVKADKPGFRGAKGKEISMFFSFCPFCGVSLKEPEQAA